MPTAYIINSELKVIKVKKDINFASRKMKIYLNSHSAPVPQTKIFTNFSIDNNSWEMCVMITPQPHNKLLKSIHHINPIEQ